MQSDTKGKPQTALPPNGLPPPALSLGIRMQSSCPRFFRFRWLCVCVCVLAVFANAAQHTPTFDTGLDLSLEEARLR